MRAVKLTDSSVSLVWDGPEDGSNVTGYVVHYQKINNSTVHENTIKLDQVRRTFPVAHCSLLFFLRRG